MSETESIGISFLNAMAYCPRRFYYEFVQADMLVNEFVLEGQLLHGRADEAGQTTDADGTVSYRRIYLYSERLGLSGFADVVEENAGRLAPVEYKHGRQGRWINDHIQLCAQALCLEERQLEGSSPIEYGYIFYWGSRRKQQIDLGPELRAKTLALLAEARRVAVLPSPPPPLEGKLTARCRDCSLEPLCLPEEVRLLNNKLRSEHSTKGGIDLANFIPE